MLSTTVVEQSLRSIISPGVSKRNDFPLRPTSMALLVIDIQRELTELDESNTNYKHAVSFPRMVINTKRLIETVRANRELMHNNNKGGGLEIIFTYLQALTDNSRDVSLTTNYQVNYYRIYPIHQILQHSYME